MRWFSSSSSCSSLLFSRSSCPWLRSSSATRCSSSYTSLTGSSLFDRGATPPRCATMSTIVLHRCTKEPRVVAMGDADDNSSGPSSATVACSCSRNPQSCDKRSTSSIG
uniref:Putative secreted peptide n=1 Tax=Anopheles braziliensis TaxID=58242 RepID=A0A2M3ZTJ3_9DIPT